MTEISPSAREAAVEDSLRHNHRDPDTQLFARRAAQISFLAGVSYQAREGKGEAGEGEELCTALDGGWKRWDGKYEKQHYIVKHGDKIYWCWPNAGKMSVMGDTREFTPADRVNIWVSYYPAPPAPKDEKVEKLIKAARLALEAFAVSERKGWLEMNPRDDLREALRAFGDGKAEGGR